MIGCVELGGTKAIVALGRSPADLSEVVRIDTRDPENTIADVIATLTALSKQRGPMEAIGIASFGPLLREGDRFTGIGRTPKPGWGGAPLVAPLARTFKVPVVLDTDVNGAAVAEGLWGAGQSMRDYAYITVGTGVGVGLVANGKPVHGLLHPEAGHMMVRRDPSDSFSGSCPFHGDCVEGLASGSALRARLGHGAETCPPDNPVWGFVADYLAQLVVTLVLVASPRRIILGGGVMEAAHLLPMVRARVQARLGGYVELPGLLEGPDPYLVAPALGARSGVLGALALGLWGKDGVDLD
jgi:fructokinase